MNTANEASPLGRAMRALAGTGCSCAVVRGGALFTAEGIGVKPLLRFLREDRRFFEGAAVADRVIGRAAALLLLGGGVSAVYGAVMSRPARADLEARGVAVRFGEEVDFIENRAHTGMCPLEEAVAGLAGPEGAVEALEARIAELMAEKNGPARAAAEKRNR